MTILELKAQAYDILANIQFLQNKLQEINQAIAKATQEENIIKGNSDGNN